MKIRTWLLAAFILFAATACAEDVVVSLDTDTLTAMPGQTVTFSGSIFNEDSSTVDLNGIDVTLNGMLFQIDLTPFFFGPPTVGASNPPFDTDTGDFQLFSVTVDDPYDAAYGVESGSVTILGGEEVGGIYDPATQNPLGSTTFHVDVVTRESPTFTLMLAAVFGSLGFVLHGRRQRGQTDPSRFAPNSAALKNSRKFGESYAPWRSLLGSGLYGSTGSFSSPWVGRRPMGTPYSRGGATT